jgi:hypothetical protein
VAGVPFAGCPSIKNEGFVKAQSSCAVRLQRLDFETWVPAFRHVNHLSVHTASSLPQVPHPHRALCGEDGTENTNPGVISCVRSTFQSDNVTISVLIELNVNRFPT